MLNVNQIGYNQYDSEFTLCITYIINKGGFYHGNWPGLGEQILELMDKNLNKNNHKWQSHLKYKHLTFNLFVMP